MMKGKKKGLNIAEVIMKIMRQIFSFFWLLAVIKFNDYCLEAIFSLLIIHIVIELHWL